MPWRESSPTVQRTPTRRVSSRPIKTMKIATDLGSKNADPEMRSQMIATVKDFRSTPPTPVQPDVKLAAQVQEISRSKLKAKKSKIAMNLGAIYLLLVAKSGYVDVDSWFLPIVGHMIIMFLQCYVFARTERFQSHINIPGSVHDSQIPNMEVYMINLSQCTIGMVHNVLLTQLLGTSPKSF